MDKRLKLNRKQQALVKKLAKVFGELRKENVGILTDWNNEYSACDFEGLYFYNNAEVIETGIKEAVGIEAELTPHKRTKDIKFYEKDILPGNWIFKHLIMKPDAKAGIRSYEENKNKPI